MNLFYFITILLYLCGSQGALTPTHANALRRHLQQAEGSTEQPLHGLRGVDGQLDRRDSRSTQASAYVSTKGPEEDDNPGDPFNAYSTEPDSVTAPAGTYYSDTGKQVLALDEQFGIWGGAWEGYKSDAKHRKKGRPRFRRQNPTRDIVRNSTAAGTRRADGITDDDYKDFLTIEHFKLEVSSQRGVQALAGTYEGARSASGSNSGFNLASKGSLGGSVYAINNDAYGPTPGQRNVVKDGQRRSVAFTNLAPNSAAHADTGFVVMASAAGGEVASTARSAKDKEVKATIGHREEDLRPRPLILFSSRLRPQPAGDDHVEESVQVGKRLRKLLLLA